MAIVGLAPAAHGANRTGRMFTGDRSGDWLYAALHRAGYANQPESEQRDDGLRLRDAYVTAVVRCAPPANKPTTDERDNCLPYLERELELLERCRVVVALGSFAWDGFLRAARALGADVPRPKPRFGHGAEADLGRWTAARLLPPEPAEHLHRQADRADDRRRLRAGAGTGGLAHFFGGATSASLGAGSRSPSSPRVTGMPASSAFGQALGACGLNLEDPLQERLRARL